MDKGIYLLLIIFLFSSLAYCISSSPGIEKPGPRDLIVTKAMNLVGSPYRYGGKESTGFDCSGFVYHVMKEVGINMNASAQTQSTQGSEIKLKDALPGDLLFFKRPKEKNIFHVSILQKTTNDQLWMIHSTTSKGVISQNFSNSEYWSSKLYKVTRLVGK